MSRVERFSPATWIGKVPPRWKRLEPRRLFRLRRESERPSDVHLTPSQRFGVLPQEDYVQRTGQQVVRNLSNTTMQHVEPGDFISHLRTFQGGLELSRCTGKVSPAYTVVTPRNGTDPEFYKFALKSVGYISQIASITDQLRDGQSMRFPEFNQTWLPAPPPDEQRAIADYLDHETAEIDAFIDNLRGLEQTGIERHWGRMSQLISYPESFPSMWKRSSVGLVSLKRLGTVTLGKMLDTSAPRDIDSVIPYLRAANIQPHGRLDLDQLNSMRFTPTERARLTLRAGDVVVVEGGVGGYGRAAHVEEDLSNVGFQNSVIRFRAHQGTDPRYVTYSLLLLRNIGYIETVSSVTSMPHFTAEKVAESPIPQASYADQRRVADLLDQEARTLTQLHSDLSNAIALAQERRSALISAAVTGQLDVTQKHRPVAEQLEDEVKQLS